ncbi:hypothetical protein Noda2021_09620 [Candidatus Dependentiae bacterium Noda2021]|nr:hypothetical protein Noda2021_09620 [Candidatus Dependentiae bacterium Noda2021]
MKSKLLVCVSVLFTVLSHACEDNNLRIVTIESQYNSQNIILDDNDKTKLDLFYYSNFTYNNRHLVLPEGIKDLNHMQSLIQDQTNKVTHALKEAEKLEKDFNEVYPSCTNNSLELAIVLTLAVAKSVTYRYLKPELITKIKSIKTLKSQLSRLQAMKNLIADHTQ